MEEDLGGERGAWNGGGFGRREGGLEWRRILEEGGGPGMEEDLGGERGAWNGGGFWRREGGLGLRLYCAAIYVLSRDYRYS